LRFGCCALRRARPHLLARFDHVFGVLDEGTARAIAGSAYLRDFSGFYEKTTVADEGHYHGIYLMGRESFVELFGPADLNLDGPPAAVGLVGIGLATEQVGAIERMEPLVEKNGLSVGLQTFHKVFGGQKVDWFKGLGPADSLNGDIEKSPIPNVEVFASEFIPSYFEVPEANKAPSMGPDDVISVARYNRRDYADRLLKDVSGATLAVTREDWSKLRAMLVAGGFHVSVGSAGARASGDVVLNFLFVPREQVGLREIDFALNSKTGMRHVEILGRSRLVVGPRAEAVWTFEPGQGK
jgi:Family of unknown function (DUF5829)